MKRIVYLLALMGLILPAWVCRLLPAKARLDAADSRFGPGPERGMDNESAHEG